MTEDEDYRLNAQNLRFIDIIKLKFVNFNNI